MCIGLIIWKFTNKEEVVYKIPELNLPIEYFSKEDVVWGYYDSESEIGYKSAAIDEGYRSFPTTTISLSPDTYSNEIKDLPKIKSDKDIFIMEGGIGHDTFREQIKEYGDMARRFLNSDKDGQNTISYVKKIDIDKDNIKESIVGTCGLFGNGCPHSNLIVKNNKIIFSTNEANIIETKDGNGFYLQWVPYTSDINKPQWNNGRGVPAGYMLTRFVMKDGNFVPIYEQEVLYVMVGGVE